jgi:hypothetical protein
MGRGKLQLEQEGKWRELMLTTAEYRNDRGTGLDYDKQREARSDGVIVALLEVVF